LAGFLFGYFFRRRARNFDRFTVITQKPTVNLGRSAAFRADRPTKLKIWYLGGSEVGNSVGPVCITEEASLTVLHVRDASDFALRA
jgi:hypothetical protein